MGVVERMKPTSKSDRALYYGEQVPFGDPLWYQGWKSPYYKETHLNFREKVRAFVEKEIKPFVSVWEEKKAWDLDLPRKAYRAGVYGALWPKKYGGTPPDGGKFDAFHEIILWDELARCGAGGVVGGCFLPTLIALPPVLLGAREELKAKVAKEVICGEKIICLAITEPYAGSDVASIRTTATKTADGKYYVVNGQKKFITSGTFGHYFVTAVRTGSPGMRGISLLLIEKGEGLKVRRLKTQGWRCSGTAHLVFSDMKVPVGNLLGEENHGFKMIMVNFNRERFVGICMANRSSRVLLEEAIKYARLRKTFGKKLIESQVIRHKIGEMARRIDSTHALIEFVAYQMNEGVRNDVLGGPIALLKVQTTKTLELCAREASQIFGGNSYLSQGIGEVVERLYREVRVAAIGGGSEEVMMDLAMRQARL